MNCDKVILLVSLKPTTYTPLLHASTRPWVVLLKQWFFFPNDWFINIICSLVLSLRIFISLKYQRQTSGGYSRENWSYSPSWPICEIDENWSMTLWMVIVIYVLRTGVGCTCGSKIIFQCVRTASCALRWIRHWNKLLQCLMLPHSTHNSLSILSLSRNIIFIYLPKV